MKRCVFVTCSVALILALMLSLFGPLHVDAAHSGGGGSGDVWFFEYSTYGNGLGRHYVDRFEFSKDSVNVPIAVFVCGSYELDDGYGGKVSCPTYRLVFFNVLHNFNLGVNTSCTSSAYNLSNGSQVYEIISDSTQYFTGYPSFGSLSVGGVAYNSFDTNIPVFDDEAALLRYFESGDLTDVLNKEWFIHKEGYDPNAYDLSLLKFKYTGSYTVGWSGLTVNGYSKATDKDLSKFGIVWSYNVDVYLGIASPGPSGDFVVNERFYDSDSSTVSSDDCLSIALDGLLSDGEYISYIRACPRWHDPNEESEYMYCVGKSSYVYLDESGKAYAYGDDPYAGFPDSTFQDDFFLDRFNTGIDWLDTLLNAFVDFINVILRAIYRIRDLIYNKNGDGLYQLLQKVVYYLNPVNLFRDFFKDILDDYIIPTIKALFVPDGAKLAARLSEFRSHFPFIDMVSGVIEDIFDALGNSLGLTAPVIEIDLSKYAGSWSYGSTVVRIDFAWYQPFKPMVDIVIAGYIWVSFLWRLYKRLPEFIHGAGMVTEQVTGFAKDTYENSSDRIQWAKTMDEYSQMEKASQDYLWERNLEDGSWGDLDGSMW